ncbi:hypothetical protein PRZ48_014111 [Zasmidium cellare]|uniref:2EXR domain-containing protein n=1 Tax=Zasmidium cellare TaxID=395010 RepID=A0ABR0E0G8_ZASCE|nr:hypothetical protein PRZ48_014111 [Zasmidium cellare]
MQTSRLLTLPPELRNKIYTLVLVQGAPIQISERSTKPSLAARGATAHYTRLLEPPFLLTCRQIRHEALPIFYGENVFFTAIKDALPPWLLAIGPEKARMVRHIRGFRPSRYFDYEWARGLAGEVEREVGCGLQAGVFRMPFGCEGWPGKVFWTGAEGDVVLMSEEGCIEHARAAFEVSKDPNGSMLLVRVRAFDG